MVLTDVIGSATSGTVKYNAIPPIVLTTHMLVNKETKKVKPVISMTVGIQILHHFLYFVQQQ